MKHYIKTTKKNPLEAVDPTLEGQQVITDPNGKVLKVVTVCGEGKTDQSFADSHDINNLLAAAHEKGLLRATTKFQGQMDDFPTYNFQEAQEQMARANSMFEELPAGVRYKFDGNPAKFMDFVNNPKNKAELIEMGFERGFDNLDYHGNIITPTPSPTPEPTPEPTPQPE